MSASLTSSLQNERWELGDEAWSRDPATGAFDLVDFRGLGTASPACNPLDLATLVGARVSVDAADRGTRPVALFPGTFGFSPITGKALPEASIGHLDAWLPPFDGRTDVRVALRPTLDIESVPDRELAMPPAGNYQFLVSACHACESGLFAIDFSRGLIYQWLPHAARWLEVYPTGAEILVESALADDAWGMVVQEPQGSTRLFMPTEDGLAIVAINPVARTYETQLVGSRCMGAPIMWQGRVHVPMLEENRKVGVYALDPDDGTLQRVDGPMPAPAAAADHPPVSSDGEVVFPLLESISASTMLCARVSTTRPVDSVLASNEACDTTFELRGEHDVRFWSARMSRPWATRPFVHAGHLFLYHPDERRMPGWRIEP